MSTSHDECIFTPSRVISFSIGEVEGELPGNELGKITVSEVRHLTLNRVHLMR